MLPSSGCLANFIPKVWLLLSNRFRLCEDSKVSDRFVVTRRTSFHEWHNDTTDEEERRGDDENDVIMEPSIETNICIICGEFGRNQELWYRCTICAAWAHSECS
ncbi:hypothetical protein C0J52_10568 [Blattella germanica]|nr:hypothetical protein C0J52_10568 [Blattella germanica]